MMKILAVALLAFSAHAQTMSVPNPIIAGSNPPVSSEGHEPGEFVAISFKTTTTSGQLKIGAVSGNANSEGEIEFRPPMRPDGDVVRFYYGTMTAFPPPDGTVTRHVIPPQWVFQSAFFIVLQIILFEGEFVLLMQHVLTGEQFTITSGLEVHYL